ncbi:MAG TPA: STAS domain-containing protein [Anaerolineae bacterium]|jgi:anti-sigma B factor antagonist
MIATLSIRESSYTPQAEEGQPQRKPVPVLTISGRLDASTVNILERALMRALSSKEARTVIVDVGEVTYISSSGLRVLLTARRQVRERGGDILLCSLTPNVRDVMSMVGFTTLFTVYEHIEEARRAAAQLA